MEYQKKILGIILIIAGAMLIVTFALLTVLLFPIPVDSGFHPGFYLGGSPEMDMPDIFKTISLAGSTMLVLFLALPSIIVGIGLIRQKRWADDLLLPMGCFYFLFFPLGTAIGIYGLVVFFADRQPDHQVSPEKMDTQRSVRY